MNTTVGTAVVRWDEAIRPAARRGLITLCATQIVSWGALFYSFPVLVGPITADTGWSVPAVMGAFSIGLGVSALAGIPLGTLVDRHGPRPVMTIGSILGVVSVAGFALSPNEWWFIAAWVLGGVAQACVFYKPAFAAINGWYGRNRVKALTTLTLVAGLSSSLFAPATASLVEWLGWRGTYVVLGIALAVITIPAHAIFLKVPWRRHHTAISDDSRIAYRAIMRSPAFVILTVVMALATFGIQAAAIALVPMLLEHGASPHLAAWGLGLCGIGQLAGRIGYAQFSAATGVRFRTVVILAMAPVTIVSTAFTEGQSLIIIVTGLALGAARGIFTLLEATAVPDRWGTVGFGWLYGVYSAPATVAMAATPWAGAVLAQWLGGYQTVFIILGLMTALAALAAPATIPRPD